MSEMIIEVRGGNVDRVMRPPKCFNDVILVDWDNIVPGSPEDAAAAHVLLRAAREGWDTAPVHSVMEAGLHAAEIARRHVSSSS